MIQRQEDGERPARWTVGELLLWTEEHFRKIGVDSPRLDAEILLATALGSTRLKLYTEYHKLVEPDERARFREAVRRRARREPVAYIVGFREFYSLAFAVTPAVLIPRPETEHLVDWALEELGEAPSEGTSVLDLGTGSGNVAISIASSRPACRVDAVDVSEEALSVARKNAESLGVAERLRFLAGSWFEALPADSGPYRLIVSNPPYIAPSEYEGLMPEVRLHEPRRALVDESARSGDGLASYRALAAGAVSRLETGGAIGVEVGAGQAGAVVDVFAARGWEPRRRIRDYGGIERVLVFGLPF